MPLRSVAPTLLLLLAITDAHAGEPLIVAHRGLLLQSPENTLANFRACLELRLGFEFDVARSKDGHLVCIHDNTVDRTTDGKGKVAEMTLAELERLDAGTWFGAKFAGERIPTVEAVPRLVSEYEKHDVLIAVDLKSADVASVRRAGKRSFIAGAAVSGHVPDNWQQATSSQLDAILTDYPLELRLFLRQSRSR